MNKLEALTSLRDAWRIGLWVPELLPNVPELHTDLTWKTFEGSTDAGFSLFKAVLPGWQWAHVPRVKNSRAGVCDLCGSIMRIYKPNVKGHTGVDDDPARALLLAIIEALIAQEEPDDKA